jgi:hypothetical protein
MIIHNSLYYLFAPNKYHADLRLVGQICALRLPNQVTLYFLQNAKIQKKQVNAKSVKTLIGLGALTWIWLLSGLSVQPILI